MKAYIKESIVLVVSGLLVIAMSSAWGAGGVVTGPNMEAPDRYVYYPGTEVLAKDEIRIIACGTGMPDQRLAQASACFLFEINSSSTSARVRCATSRRS
jgi:hypothetical protein